jgi:pimeloyl-ACP methyl ester carboxylesterase
VVDLTVTLAVAAGIFTGMAWPFFRFITYAGRKEEKAVPSIRKKWFRLKHTQINHPKYGYEEEYLAAKQWCEEQNMQDMFITSRDGLRLHAFYLPADNSKRIILLSHGYRGSSFGSMAHMAEFLHENDSDILFIDQRCCGKSEGEYITFGAKEKYDILDWLELLNEKNKRKLPIYLFGQSMGAATVLLASEYDLPDEVHGLIADCGFHSMKQQLRDIASGWFHLHWIELLLIRVDMFCRIFAGFKMKETDTSEALKKNTKPVLFFHGDEDTYVWPRNSVLNYELCNAPKELVIVPGARHLCSSYVNPELYKEKLKELFERYDNNPTL